MANATSIYGMLPGHLIRISRRIGEPAQEEAHDERIRSSFHSMHLIAAPDRLGGYRSGPCSQKKSKPLRSMYHC